MQGIARLQDLDGSETHAELAVRKLHALCAALDRSADSDRVRALFLSMAGEWGRVPLGSEPAWPSDITDAGMPFELSAGFRGDDVALRFLLESQATRVTPRSSWEAGLALNQRLSAAYGVDLSQFEQIAGLFEPISGLPARFLLWHAVVLDADAPPRFKVYLNPQVVGKRASARVLEQAFARLGRSREWAELAPLTEAEGEFLYFSLDLAPEQSARIKVYRSHPRATAHDLAERLSRLDVNDIGEVEEWIATLTGTRSPLCARPVLTCHAFRWGRAAPEVTLHVPVRAYADNDAQALSRALEVLPASQGRRLATSAQALADGPLERSLGLLTYLSLRRDQTQTLCVTAYLAPKCELAAQARLPSSLPPSAAPRHSTIRELRSDAERNSTFADIEQAILRQKSVFAAHAFFARLRSQGSVEDVRLIAPRLAFFVLCFQDVLRLVHERISDPELKELARTHRGEDAGHDLWFLSDLERFGVPCDVRWLFSADHGFTRDIAYAQLSDVLNTDDCARFSVALSLEAAGAVFFAHIIGFLERMGQSHGLRYFARSHQHIEQSHDVFESETQRRLHAIEIPQETLPEVLAVIDRTFASLSDLNDDLERRLREVEVQRLAGLAMPTGDSASRNRLPEFARLAGVEVDTDALTLAPFSGDFGGLVRGRPLARVRPTTTDELARVISAARRTGVSLTPRGAGLSQSGQSIAAEAIVLDMSQCRRVHEPDPGGESVRCEAGATYRDVLARTLSRGLVPRVTPLNLDLTVGGVLSAGGFGSTSHKFGPAVSHLVEADVVLGSGERVKCGPTLNRAVFDAVFGGVGRSAAIGSVVLQLMPLPARMRTYFLMYDDLDRILEDAALVRPRADHLEISCVASMHGLRVAESGGRKPLVHWLYSMQVSLACDDPRALSTDTILSGLSPQKVLHVSDDAAAAFYARYDARFASMRDTGAWAQPHPWFEVMLPGSRASGFIRDALEALPPFWGDGHRISLVAASDRPKALAFPVDGPVIGFSVLPAGIPGAYLERALASLGELDTAARALGGKRYLSGWLPNPTEASFREHYGRDFDELAAAKSRFDPTGVFRSRMWGL